MKRLAPIIVLALICACFVASVAWAQTTPSAAPTVDRSPGAPVAHALTTVTGVAISPLLGTSALGAFQWWHAKTDTERAKLPWYAQPKFWLPALIVVALCAAKDAAGPAVPPPLKKPLDALEVVENKFSGLVAAGAVIPYAMDAFSRLLLQETSHASATFVPSGLAMIPVLGVNWAPALDILTIPFGIAIFAVVWMASHAINVLILLSPWGGIDAALKAARTGLLGLLALTATLNPWVGALLSIVVIVVAYFIAGWAFRLTIFGTVLSWDFFTRRRYRFHPASNDNAMFSSAALGVVPVRTYGKLHRRDDGTLEFAYRPWLVRPVRSAPVATPTAQLAVGSGLFFSIVAAENTGTYFLLPPRYRGHEPELVQAYALGGGIRPAGLRKAWHSFKELVGGRAAPAPATL